MPKTELNRLTEEQTKDQDSQYVSKDARESNFEYHALVELSDDIQAGWIARLHNNFKGGGYISS